jgi:hypothetical protein
MPGGLMTVDELPDAIKARVRDGETYTVDALNAGWLIRQMFTMEPGDTFSEDTSAVRAADIRKVELGPNNGTVHMVDPVDGSVLWFVPLPIARALLRTGGQPT